MWFRNIFQSRTDRTADTRLVRETTADLNPSPQVYRLLDQLQLRTSRLLHGTGTGRRPSSRRRPASDFREHRKYVPGDDVRFVDWKASARHEQFFLKQGEQPQENTIHVLLDTSESMRWGTPPKRDQALRLTAVLGYLALANEDRFHLEPLTGGDSARLRLNGKGQYPTLLNNLWNLSFEGRVDLNETFQSIRRGHRGGVVYLLSDLLDVGDLNRSLRALPSPQWQVVVLHLLHPQELKPELQGDFELADVETGRRKNYDLTPKAIREYERHLQSWRNALEMTCIQNQAFYTLIPTTWSLESMVIPHLRRYQIFVPM